MDPTSKNLFDQWARQIEAHQVAHDRAAKQLESQHYWVGLPATIFAAVAGGTLFTELQDPMVKVLIGAIGLLAAVLTAVQTFLSLAKRAEQHRSAATQLGALKRSIEIVQEWPLAGAEAKQFAEEINKRLTEIENSAPTVNVAADVGPLMRMSPAIDALSIARA
jgi:hypothetical protein